MNSLPIVDVYVFRMPDTFEISRVLPIERQNEIEGIKNEQVKKQKYYS